MSFDIFDMHVYVETIVLQTNSKITRKEKNMIRL